MDRQKIGTHIGFAAIGCGLSLLVGQVEATQIYHVNFAPLAKQAGATQIYHGHHRPLQKLQIYKPLVAIKDEEDQLERVSRKLFGYMKMPPKKIKNKKPDNQRKPRSPIAKNRLMIKSYI